MTDLSGEANSLTAIIAGIALQTQILTIQENRENSEDRF